MQPEIFVESDRLILREIVPSDVDNLFVLDSDPLVNKYLGTTPLKTKQESEKVIDYIRQQYVDNGIGRWAVILKDTNEFIGWSGLKLEKEVRPNVAYYDLGYRFIPKYWGNGYATESAIVSIEYGFNQFQLNEICAAAQVGNAASNKVIKGSGLQFIETFFIDGELHNWYALHKDFWTRK